MAEKQSFARTSGKKEQFLSIFVQPWSLANCAAKSGEIYRRQLCAIFAAHSDRYKYKI